MSKIKNEASYQSYSAFGENGLGKAVELHVTVWQKIPQFEIYTSRGMGLCLDGTKAKEVARELIELLQPIADHGKAADEISPDGKD